MSWMIELNNYKCPYLNKRHVKLRRYQDECYHPKNIEQECNSTNYPIKVII